MFWQNYSDKFASFLTFGLVFWMFISWLYNSYLPFNTIRHTFKHKCTNVEDVENGGECGFPFNRRVTRVFIDSYTDLAVLGLLCRAWMAGFHSLWLWAFPPLKRKPLHFSPWCRFSCNWSRGRTAQRTRSAGCRGWCWPAACRCEGVTDEQNRARALVTDQAWYTKLCMLPSHQIEWLTNNSLQ